MKTPYEEIITNSQALLSNLEIAKILYSSLKTKLNEKQDEHPFQQICSSLIETFTSEFGESGYFKLRTPVISYEWAIELYWIIRLSQSKTKGPYTDLELTRNYHYEMKVNAKAEDTDKRGYADCRIAIQKQFSEPNPASSIFSCRKYNNYKKLLKPLVFDNILLPGTLFKDNYFYIRGHEKTPFGSKFLGKGVRFNLFSDFIQEYITLYPKISFEAEFSAFIFEKLYSGISYQLYILELLQHCNDDDFPITYWPLYTFSKLFDTHNLSLIEYTRSAYLGNKNLFFDINKGSDLRYYSYIHFQQNNNFYLPLLFNILTLYLNEHYNGETKDIADMLKSYIEKIVTNPQSSKISYYSTLQNAYNSVKLLKKHLPSLKCKKATTKYKILVPDNRNDSKSYLFNMEICRLFYNEDTPNLIQNYYSMDSVFYHLNNKDLEPPYNAVFTKPELPLSVLSTFNSVTQTIKNNYQLGESLHLTDEFVTTIKIKI